MRIVYLADAPHVHTRRWIEHFVAQGHACTVISFRPAEMRGVDVRYVEGFERLGKARYLIHARRVGRAIRALEPDLVHALHLTSYGFLGALASVRPLIISVWGTDILEAPHLTPFHRWLTRFSLARADQITATGLHLATETARHVSGTKPVTVVPYGVDLARFSSLPRAKRDAVVIGTAARLSPEKGLRHLLRAFALLRERLGDQVSLRIAGEDQENGAHQRLARKLGIADATEFLGEIEHSAVPAFLQSIDIFALPSIYESFGVAAVEAAAMSLPVVGSNVYGIPDVVVDGATGLLVPAKDAVALAEALESLVRDRARRLRMGEAGRAYVAARYDWSENVRQMERVYAAAVSGRPGEVTAWT